MILHIVNKHEWDEALQVGTYAPPSLHTEGFVHCSTSSQIGQTANRYFQGQNDLILLCLDETRLKSEVRYESSDEQVFPHVYGPINLDAVVCVVDLAQKSDGSFDPANLPK